VLQLRVYAIDICRADQLKWKEGGN